MSVVIRSFFRVCINRLLLIEIGMLFVNLMLGLLVKHYHLTIICISISIVTILLLGWHCSLIINFCVNIDLVSSLIRRMLRTTYSICFFTFHLNAAIVQFEVVSGRYRQFLSIASTIFIRLLYKLYSIRE